MRSPAGGQGMGGASWRRGSGIGTRGISQQAHSKGSINACWICFLAMCGGQLLSGLWLPPHGPPHQVPKEPEDETALSVLVRARQ